MNITSYKPFVRNPITSREDLALSVRLIIASDSLRMQSLSPNARHPGDWPDTKVRVLKGISKKQKLVRMCAGLHPELAES